MAENLDLPIYNLKAVVQETGLKPDTLRAWERRYGLPEPQRTLSGHRLYTERDVATLRWLIARQDEGLTISRAVALWHELTRQGSDPLDRALAAPRRPDAARTSLQLETFEGKQSPLADLQRRWIDACLRFDERAAEQILNSAFALLPVEPVVLGLIRQALADIGDAWRQGSATAQQEHFASALAMRRLEALLVATPAPTRRERILVGCPPHELHTFAPLTLSLFLRRRGWDVLYLGADVPLHSLEATIDDTMPNVAVLTAQQLHTAASLLEMARLLESKGIALAYGGLIFNQFPDLRKIIPGHFLGESLDSAALAVEEILRTPHVRPSVRPMAAESVVALRRFREQRSAIESDVWRSVRENGFSPAGLAEMNAAFGRNLEAALELGLLHMHGASNAVGMPADQDGHSVLLPAGVPPDYLHAYAVAAQRRLDASARPLTHLLANLAGFPSGMDDAGGIKRKSKKLSRLTAIDHHRRA